LHQTSLINTQRAWESAAAKFSREPELALDTESNSLYAYRERICLIQMGTREETLLVDPLAIKDLSTLGELLGDPSIVKILHGSDYDLRSFDRDYGFKVQALFDTETAARFLGQTSPNLASVLETFLGIGIPKSRKVQRSNWAVRPLTPLAREYATNDVCYLVQLACELRQRLAMVDRLDWVQEECRRMEQFRYIQPDPPQLAFLRARGTEQLGPQALAVFKELFIWRDAEARRCDRPPFRVVGNEALAHLAQVSTSVSRVSLEKVVEAAANAPKEYWHGMQGAIEQGLAAPEVHRPQSLRNGTPWGPECRVKLQRLKQWRTRRAASLELDPALLWPAASLERLALQPLDWTAEVLNTTNADVRAWQRREFGQELRAVLGVGDEAQAS
jgi:ribonuclease D